MDKTIRSVKIDPEKHTLVVDYYIIEGSGDSAEKVERPGEKHSARLHPDLIAALQNLSIHIAVMCGFVSPTQIKDIKNYKPELADTFKVTGFSLGKDEDDPGVVITGGRNLPNMNNKYISLNTPYVRYSEDEKTAYKFIGDLEDRVDRLKEEVLLYLSGEKRGADPQQSLFNQGDGEQGTAGQSEAA